MLARTELISGLGFLTTLLLLSGVFFQLACSGGTGKDSAVDQETVLELEEQRYQAMVEQNVETLDSMLDDDLIFTHASGKIDTKATFLESLGSGTLIYKAVEIDNVKVRVYGDCGVINGESRLDLHVRGEDRTLNMLFTTVWVRDSNGWKVVAYQSTRQP